MPDKLTTADEVVVTARGVRRGVLQERSVRVDRALLETSPIDLTWPMVKDAFRALDMLVSPEGRLP